MAQEHSSLSLGSQLGLSAEQQAAVAAEYLSELPPGRLPYPIFSEVARLMVTATVEMGIIKLESAPKIYLKQRDVDDQWWPSQWHVPGSVILASDEIADDHDYTPAVGRIMDEVGGSVRMMHEPNFFDVVHRGKSRDAKARTGDALRGSEVTLHAVVEVRGEPAHGAFFDAEDVLHHPPEGGLIEGHDTVVKKMIARYEAMRGER